MLVSRVSVAIVFSVLGVSFLTSTALLIYEFREVDWVTLVVTHGHLFLFFPIFLFFTRGCPPLPHCLQKRAKAHFLAERTKACQYFFEFF